MNVNVVCDKRGVRSGTFVASMPYSSDKCETSGHSLAMVKRDPSSERHMKGQQ